MWVREAGDGSKKTSYLHPFIDEFGFNILTDLTFDIPSKITLFFKFCNAILISRLTIFTVACNKWKDSNNISTKCLKLMNRQDKKLMNYTE